MNTDALIALVNDVKTAIQHAQDQTPDVAVTKAELELKTTFSGGAGVDWKIAALELSGKYTQSEVQTLHLVLTPQQSRLVPFSKVSDRLADAIAAISSAAKAAADSQPSFTLEASTVTLNLGVDKGGKAMIVAGGSAASSNYHTLTLTIGPAA